MLLNRTRVSTVDDIDNNDIDEDAEDLAARIAWEEDEGLVQRRIEEEEEAEIERQIEAFYRR